MRLKFMWGILFAGAAAVNILTLKDGHNIGDDFSQYILNAQNILAHKPYASGIMLDNPTIYPPGFPLILAPVIKLFGLNWKILKAINIVFWFGSLGLLYRIFLRNMKSKTAAVLSCLFLAAAPHFFLYKQNVLSDIPFFFFVCLSFYVWDRWEDLKRLGDAKGQGMAFILFLAAASYAFWVRTVGIIILLAAVFYFLAIERQGRLWRWTFFVVLMNIALQAAFLGVHPGILTKICHAPLNFILASLSNLPTIFCSLGWFFCPPVTGLAHTLYDFINPELFFMAPFLCASVLWLFFTRIWKKTLSFVECFSIFYLLIFIFWSGFTVPPGTFTRFILPLLPFVFILAHQLARRGDKFKSVLRVIYLILFCVNVVNIAMNLEFDDDVINLKETQELVAWVKGHVGQGEHFMFYRPRLLALLTSRVGTAPFAPGPYSNIFERISKFKIAYVILPKFLFPVAIFESKPRDFLAVWDNGTYKIFKTNLP